MSALNINKSDLIVNKASALRIGAQAFLTNKRVTSITLRTMGRFIHLEFRGKRDAESIRNGIKITSTVTV
jgi:hypothetical protein